MKITIKLGAKKDGTLTAMQIHTVSNTGAYGNHGGEVLASSLGSAMATYRCPNKKGTGYAVYTNTVPSGAFRGYGATQPAFAIESAIDELGRKLGIDPFTMRRRNMIRPHDPVHSIWPFPHDGVIGSYGLDQCLDFVEQALASGRGEPKPDGDEWLEGRGVAIHAQDCAPPTEHRSEAHLALLPDGTYHLAVGSAEFGNGIRNAQRQVAATVLNARAAAIAMDFADTDKTPYDTGTFASTGTSVATLAVQRAAEALRENLLELASQISGVPVERMPTSKTGRCSAESDRSRCRSSTRPRRCADKLHVSRKVYGSPRSTAFLAHGFRIAVHRVTGEIRILQSVQALRRRHDHQPDAGARAGRGRHRPGDRHDPLRADGDRRVRRRRESHLPQLPHSGLRRHPPLRDLLRRHARPLWPARREAARRGAHHPRRARPGQRARRRDGHPLPQPALQRRPDFRAIWPSCNDDPDAP